MTVSAKLKGILKGLGYTPETLAASLNISPRDAKRILSETGCVYACEFSDACTYIGLSPAQVCEAKAAIREGSAV